MARTPMACYHGYNELVFESLETVSMIGNVIQSWDNLRSIILS